ncbi:type II toxin-antitoxin system Phd/YefM family antitoxin [Burkholderia anthina]|uniref:type II toxin-antitoxin system Phd/YefM family antitoxin n=1 Tax=Burkholderia anthina TaxID=179879 RepID=UPI000754210E|nr:type II toxin-antitoxin system Phd/YefM family antitoxin [Burkholderia anthina]KWH62156.1 prevent-host-death protein [Burkholderia anthina]
MMPHAPVSKSEFKARALEYFRLVEASGESLIVTDHGKPTLEIRPYRSREAQPLDILRGSVMRYDNHLDPIAEDDWEASR